MTQEMRNIIASYVYKWPKEVQSAMEKDIEFGYSLCSSELEAARKEIEQLKRDIETQQTAIDWAARIMESKDKEIERLKLVASVVCYVVMPRRKESE